MKSRINRTSLKTDFARVAVAFFMLIVIVMLSSARVNAEEYFYDNLDRLVKVVYEDGSVVEYFYDANGNLLEVKVHKSEANVAPSAKPTARPTVTPTMRPMSTPETPPATPAPTSILDTVPTIGPTMEPAITPTSNPSGEQSSEQIAQPTATPSDNIDVTPAPDVVVKLFCNTCG